MPGSMQIEDQEVRHGVAGARQRRRPRRDDLRRVPGLLQVVRDQIGDVAVVLDDQHAAHAAALPQA